MIELLEMNFDIEEEHYFITLNGINAEVTIESDAEFKEIKFKNALLDGSGKHTVELIKGKFSLVLCHLDDNQEIGFKFKYRTIFRVSTSLRLVRIPTLETLLMNMSCILFNNHNKGLFKVSSDKGGDAVQS